MSSRKGIYIPHHLVKLLLAERKDYRTSSEYNEMQKLAKAMLRLLAPAKEI